MKKQQVMALLLSSTLTIANVTPALAADTSNVAVTSEVTQETPAEDTTADVAEAAPAMEEETETSAEETENTKNSVEEALDEQKESQAEDIATQTADQENPVAVLEENGDSLPINSTFEENYLVYKVTGDKQVTVTEHDIAEYWDDYCDVVINPTVEHDGVTYQVVAIDEMAFMDDWTIKSFTFKEGVTQIGKAFMGGCKNVENVTIEDPTANLVVKDGCVYNSDMTRLEAMIPNYPMESYTTPDSVTVIGSRSIQSNTCKVVTLGDNVTTLEDSATVQMPGTEIFNMGSGITKMDNGQFNDCESLKELNIKGSFMPGSEFVFNCPKLEKVTLDGNIKGSLPNFFVNCPNLKSIDVINSSYQRSVDGVLFNGNTLMRYPAAKEDTSYYIPDGYSVTGQAFNGCKNLKTLYVGSDVTLKAGMVQDPSNPIDIYLLDKEKISIGTKSSYIFINLPEGSNIYCASKDRLDELNAYSKVATSDNGILPTIGVKKVAYESATFTDTSEKEELFVGGEVQHLASNLTPAYANDDLVYTSSNEKICTVDAGNGTVKGVAQGDCEISVSSKESGKVLDSYEIHVSKVSVKAITLNKTELTMTLKDEPQKLKLTFDPVDSETTTGLTWESSDDKIVKVEDGVVTAVGIGSATITATIQGKTAKCEVRVLAPLESIQLDKATADLKKGETVDLNVKFNPVYTTDDKTVTWKSSNENIATVDKNGKVTAVGAGEATITATVGNFTETCKVTVSIPLEAIEMAEKYNLELGETEHLRPRANPIDTTADLTKMKWASSNPDVVKVDENGNMTGVAYGTATITAELDGVKASCEVTVVRPGLDKAEVTLSQETFTYDGTEKRPEVTVKLDGQVLTEGKDYQVGYYNNVNAGTASVAIRAEGEQHGMIVKMFTIKRADINDAEISGISNKTYNGSAQTQNVTVTLSGKILRANTDYTVSYKNNIQAGTATVVITGKGNYEGSLQKAFTIKASGQWIKSGNRWWYRHANGSYTKNGWELINGKWYRFDKAGWMLTGWQKVNGKWYYMNGSGAMMTGWLKDRGSWYYLNSNGAMATGWAKVSGKWYYMNGSGKMLTGWQKIGKNWYYLNSNGSMAENTWVGKYYVNASGVWVKTR